MGVLRNLTSGAESDPEGALANSASFSSDAFEICQTWLLFTLQICTGEGRLPHTSMHRGTENCFAVCSHLYVHIQDSLCRTLICEAAGLDSAPGYFINCVCSASAQSSNVHAFLGMPSFGKLSSGRSSVLLCYSCGKYVWVPKCLLGVRKLTDGAASENFLEAVAGPHAHKISLLKELKSLPIWLLSFDQDHVFSERDRIRASPTVRQHEFLCLFDSFSLKIFNIRISNQILLTLLHSK